MNVLFDILTCTYCMFPQTLTRLYLASTSLNFIWAYNLALNS